jgi:hypothetical protein
LFGCTTTEQLDAAYAANVAASHSSMFITDCCLLLLPLQSPVWLHGS